MFSRGVAALRSFSAAARALELPKSSVSRSVARLETELGTRLLQRTTREVVLTEAGALLRARCADILASIGEAVELVGGFASAPRGLLRVSASLGFGVHMLGSALPQFLERYPEIEISLRLGSRSIDLLGDGIDVAIHTGPLADSQLIASRLGSMPRYLCAAPAYLERRGTPCTIEELRDHDRIETPGDSGRPRSWVFSNETGQTVRFEEKPRVTANDAVTIHRLIVNGGGIGVLSGFICGPDFAGGPARTAASGVEHARVRGEHRIPEWSSIVSDSAGLHRLPQEFTRYGEAVARQRAASLNVAAILSSPCVIPQRADRRYNTQPHGSTAGAGWSGCGG